MTQSSTVSLADKYELPKGRVFMTGTQALVRLMLAQKARDEAAEVIRVRFAVDGVHRA